ncbi:MAG: type II toxin-antitoxin system PemK/MazF family toxin [bacterium]
MRRGEIRWYTFKKPDKRRPVLILTRDSILEYLGEVTVAPVTTTVRGIPSEVSLSAEDGMPRGCAINCDHLQTVSKAKVGGAITAVSASKMVQVTRAIRFALDL